MGEERDLPPLTVVVPVGEANGAFDRCLAALEPQLGRHDELVVVFDGPHELATAGLRRATKVLSTQRHHAGPAIARNLGAAAAGNDVLVFVDADVELDAAALMIVGRRFAQDPDLDAVFGSYDDDPAAPGIVSQYKNLLHHFVHHRSAGAAVTFWTGCGAIRRASFEEMDGFDESYRRPSIEDIELGMRLHEHGGTVELDPTIRGKHLKRWTLTGLLVTDVRDRAVPWSQLIVDRWWFPTTLNVDWRSRVSAVLVLASVLLFASTPWWAMGALLGCVLVAAAALLQLDFFRFLVRRRGIVAALACVPIHLVYHFYSAVSFGFVVLATPWRRIRGRSAAVA